MTSLLVSSRPDPNKGSLEVWFSRIKSKTHFPHSATGYRSDNNERWHSQSHFEIYITPRLRLCMQERHSVYFSLISPLRSSLQPLFVCPPNLLCFKAPRREHLQRIGWDLNKNIYLKLLHAKGDLLATFYNCATASLNMYRLAPPQTRPPFSTPVPIIENTVNDYLRHMFYKLWPKEGMK